MICSVFDRGMYSFAWRSKSSLVQSTCSNSLQTISVAKLKLSVLILMIKIRVPTEFMERRLFFELCSRGAASYPHNEISVAVVKWDVGRQDRYRVGFNGMVDLKCVEAAKGLAYYRSHLPLCGWLLCSTLRLIFPKHAMTFYQLNICI